jgi:hypothetical protein
MKSEDAGLQIISQRKSACGVEQSLVPDVNTIEVSDGKRTGAEVSARFFERTENSLAHAATLPMGISKPS